MLSDLHLEWDGGNQCSVHRGQPKTQAQTQPSPACYVTMYELLFHFLLEFLSLGISQPS